MEPFAKETLPVSLEEEMRRSYLDYAMSVIVGRALPDVRDGLKPVHRRILYGMNELGNHWNRAYKKSARVSGDVMGKYHPHGDAAIYDTMVRLAQPFSMRYVLIDGQGNFGSVDGDNAAASRYTEVRLTRLAHEMLADIDRETVDFVPNYDGQETEPTVLPARVPNLLVNGAAGIAVGMATNIPPHNLGEVVDACLHVLHHPGCAIEELIKLVPAPDFPTAGIIVGLAGVHEGYTLALTDPVWVRTYLPETYLGQIKPGARARITTDSYPNKVYAGWVGSISPTAEFTPKNVETPDLRTRLVYQVRVFACNPQNELRLGMPATVTIDLTHVDSVVAPEARCGQTAIQPGPQTKQ